MLILLALIMAAQVAATSTTVRISPRGGGKPKPTTGHPLSDVPESVAAEAKRLYDESHLPVPTTPVLAPVLATVAVPPLSPRWQKKISPQQIAQEQVKTYIRVQRKKGCYCIKTEQGYESGCAPATCCVIL